MGEEGKVDDSAKEVNTEEPKKTVLPVLNSKEELKIHKKLIRKKRREEEQAAGVKKVKKEKKEENKEAPSPATPKGKKKVKAKDGDKVKLTTATDDASEKKDKGKRFDIGRVIDAFPSKKASFAEVTSRVLEEFKQVKIQPDMEEKRLVNKINKKIELNPNINIKNGEIILV